MDLLLLRMSIKTDKAYTVREVNLLLDGEQTWLRYQDCKYATLIPLMLYKH